MAAAYTSTCMLKLSPEQCNAQQNGLHTCIASIVGLSFPELQPLGLLCPDNTLIYDLMGAQARQSTEQTLCLLVSVAGTSTCMRLPPAPAGSLGVWKPRLV